MGVYKRTDSATWWMSLQVEGKRVRMNTQVTDRRLAEQIFAAWQVEQARARWFGVPPERNHTVQELLDEYQRQVTPRKSAASQERDLRVCHRLVREWGPLTLAELQPKRIEEYLATRVH